MYFLATSKNYRSGLYFLVSLVLNIFPLSYVFFNMKWALCPKQTRVLQNTKGKNFSKVLTALCKVEKKCTL